jgi:hypothetical protein
MILPAQKRAATVAINRVGLLCSITEPVDEDYHIDGYGKAQEESWSEVAVEPVVRIYQRGGSPGQRRVAGGRFPTESPLLIFVRDSVVTTGYRVSYESEVYEIDSLTTYPTHFEAETTLVE